MKVPRKAFRCRFVSSNQKWVLKEVEGGGDFMDVPGLPHYQTLAECEAMQLRLDAIENGDG